MIQINRLFLITLAAAVSTAVAQTKPTTAPVTQPTAANLEVHEWSVFVIDGATGQLNPEGIVTATLPGFVTDHRFGSAGAPAPDVPVPIGMNNFIIVNRRAIRVGATPAAKGTTPVTENDEPSPVGIIRLIGLADSKVDVNLQSKGGTFLGSWPKAEDRANSLLWRDLTVAEKSDAVLSGVGANHWFSALRSVNSSYLSSEKSGTEKFLLYDLQMPYPSPLKVKQQADFSVEFSNNSSTQLHHLVFYQGGEKQTWRSAEIGELAAVTALLQLGNPIPPTKEEDKLFATTAPVTQPAQSVAKMAFSPAPLSPLPLNRPVRW